MRQSTLDKNEHKFKDGVMTQPVSARGSVSLKGDEEIISIQGEPTSTRFG